MRKLASFVVVTIVILQCIDDSTSECTDSNVQLKIQKQKKRGDLWMVKGVIKSTNFQNKLTNWTLKLNLTAPLATNLKVKAMLGSNNTKNQTEIVLRPKKKGKTFGEKTRIKFTASFSEKQENMTRCGVLCGNDVETGEYMCNNKSNATEPVEEEKPPNFHDQFVNEWQLLTSNGTQWFTASRIKPTFNYSLENWNLTMEFREPLVKDLRAWIATGFKGSAGQSKVVLTAQSWNQLLEPHKFLMSYEVVFHSKQNKNHLAFARFCGTLPDSQTNICEEN